MKVQPIRQFLVAVVACCLWGCGGDKPTPSRPAANSPSRGGIVAAAPPRFQQPPVITPNTDNEADNEADGERSKETGPKVDPHNLFTVVEPKNTFVITGTEPEIKPTDRFTANIPAAGENSRTFSVAEPNQPPSSRSAGGNVSLPAGFVALPEGGYTDEGLPRRIVSQKDGMIMAVVPGGRFTMGKNDGPVNTTPAIPVLLNTFYIDVTEVTLEQFARYRDDVRKTLKRFRREPANASSESNHPALGLTWGEARQYAKWVGKGLPTEAEWEKAARGESGFDYVWGNGRAVWGGIRNRDQIDPVGSYRTDVSPYGVFDLAGNAQEWCVDWYSENLYSKLQSRGEPQTWVTPKIPSVRNYRVVRGGGPTWAAWHRKAVETQTRDPKIGFRCVLRAF